MSTESPSTVPQTYPQPNPSEQQRAFERRIADPITVAVAGRTIDATLLGVDPDFSAIAPDFRLRVGTDAGELVVSPSAVV